MPVFTSPGNIAFSIFGFDIYFYGILMGIAISIALGVILYFEKHLYQGYKYITETAPYVILGGIIGARVYYCLLSGYYYIQHPLEILNIRGGGLSIHGAILGGIITLWIICLKYKSKDNNISFAKMCDIYAFGIPIGQSVARWGNFFNSEAFGLPCDLPWKLYIPYQYRPEKYINSEYFHPTFLYESIFDFIIFLILIYLLQQNKSRANGFYILTYLILYSICRIFIELIRTDSIMSVYGISLPIIVSIITIIISAILLIKIRN